MLKRLQNKQSSYDVFKWEEERAKNEKLVKRIALFGNLATESLTMKSKTMLPTLKHTRSSQTRMTKRRIKKNYEEDFKMPDPRLVNKKRAKTTRRKQKRSLTVEHEPLVEEKVEIDITKCCHLPEDREIITKSTKVMSNYQFELEISKNKTNYFIAAVRQDKHSENY